MFTGHRKIEEVLIHYVEYRNDHFLEIRFDKKDFKDHHLPNKNYVQWYDFRGLHDEDIIKDLGAIFALHPLVLEDIVDVHQRPKFDVYKEYCFFKFDALQFNNGKFEKESISIIIGDGYVLSFQEDEKDTLIHVRDRIKAKSGRIVEKNSDYLAYALIDTVVDQYYEALDAVALEVEELDERITINATEDIKKDIQNLKVEFLQARKSIGPLREAINQFAKSDHPAIQETTAVYIRDVYDHTVQIMDFIETNRDILSGLQDLYLSEISFKMNKVMQVLTIVTTVFVPLSFLVGLYGMNFSYMPELQYRNGYFYLVGFMIILVIILLSIFKKRRWL